VAIKVSRGVINRAAVELVREGHLIWVGPLAISHLARRAGLNVSDLRGSMNSTGNLIARFRDLPLWQRVPLQISTALLNNIANPLGIPNHILAALTRTASTPEPLATKR
jgi:hypothetical protein